MKSNVERLVVSGEGDRWINLESEDEHYLLRGSFVRGCVADGMDSLQKLMAVTYLSQFEDPRGEFYERSVFTPDFCMLHIPFSSELLEIVDTLEGLGHINSYDGDLSLSVSSSDPGEIFFVNDFFERGAQLGRLYLANKDTLKRFEGEDGVKSLYLRVRECVDRDRRLHEIFSYAVRVLPRDAAE